MTQGWNHGNKSVKQAGETGEILVKRTTTSRKMVSQWSEYGGRKTSERTRDLNPGQSE